VYTLAADLTLLIHVAFAVFVIGGQILIFAGCAFGWNWTRNRTFRWLHLAAIGLVAWEAWTSANCPLTLLENHWRRLAGLSDSFIAHWTHHFLYYSIPEVGVHFCLFPLHPAGRDHVHRLSATQTRSFSSPSCRPRFASMMGYRCQTDHVDASEYIGPV